MHFLYKLSLIIVLFFAPLTSMAQSFLNKQVSIDAKRRPVGEVLKTIGRQGGFYFSYNSDLIQDDSLVSISVQQKSVKQILNILFDKNFEYAETQTHIIIQPSSAMFWYATGYVKDDLTGENIAYASVYEKTQFVSTLTNELGYFRLRLKDRNKPAVISVSKSWYTDTAVIINASYRQDVRVGIKPKNFELDTFVITKKNGVEGNWLSRMFLSSRQRMQGMNLGKFFADKPYQTSLIPGVGTHGKMSGQAVNHFSFNLLGGYSGGLNGFEMAGVFNILKTDVRGAEVAGVFNIAGGRVSGLQIAGVYNHVLKASEGWQFAGIANFVNNSLTGLQVAGAYNHVWGKTVGIQGSGIANMAKDTVIGTQIAGTVNLANNHVHGAQIAGTANFAKGDIEGTQIAGTVNFANGDMDGVQVAGMANITRKTMKGTQVSPFMNYAKHVKGVQIGLVNVADTSSGVSIGFFNFILKGYHKISISSNEVTNFHVAGKFGNRNLYTILSFGANTGNNAEAYTFGYGWGGQIKLNKRLSVNPEITLNQLYLGDWQFVNGLGRIDMAFNYKFNKFLTAFAGPSYSFSYIDQTVFPAGYRSDLPYKGTIHSQHDTYVSSWLGWTFGISVF